MSVLAKTVVEFEMLFARPLYKFRLDRQTDVLHYRTALDFSRCTNHLTYKRKTTKHLRA